MLSDLHHQVGKAVHEGVALVLGYSEVVEHPFGPVLDISSQHVVALVPFNEFLLVGEQEFVLVLLEALIVIMGEFLVLALQREDLVFADGDVLETILDVEQLPLESVDPLECVVIEFVVFFHPLEDLFRFDDV